MPQNREACDGCHAMKTRCTRPKQSSSCIRCDRLGLSCNYSPPGRTGRPLGTRRSQATSGTQCRRSTGETFASVAPDSYPDGSTDGSMENMDMLIDSNCSIDSSVGSDFLLDSFFTDSTQLSAFPTTTTHSYSTSISTGFLSDFNNSGDDAHHTRNTLEDLATRADRQSIQARLVGVQTDLEKLFKKFTQGSNAADDIKDVFRLTEIMLKIIKEIEEQPQRCKASSHGSDQNMPGVVALLLSSCYLSLIHVYQRLVGTLGQELDEHQASRNTSNVMDSKPSISLPFISIGGVKLDMPRSATVKIKIHLLAQNVNHLKASLQSCVTRLKTTRPTASSLSGDQDLNQTSSLGLMDGLIGLAISDIQTREEKLLHQIRMLLLDPGTKTYITR